VPFLRVIRDKRGYETTYLMHWCREGTKQRSRILYVFRSPGGMRVGREALEPDILKQIEAEHPDIEFDWAAVLHNQQVIESAVEPRRTRKRPASEASTETPQAAPPPPQAPTLRFTVPSGIEGATPDEQVAFLARWYGEVREKIPQRAPDPARQQVLLALAERLNPASWTDADQITAGLQEASDALQRLSHVFAKRRRRSKKRGAKAASPAPGGPASQPAVDAADAADPADAPDSDSDSDSSDVSDISDPTPDE
jgi:hypothetical protein